MDKIVDALWRKKKEEIINKHLPILRNTIKDEISKETPSNSLYDNLSKILDIPFFWKASGMSSDMKSIIDEIFGDVEKDTISFKESIIKSLKLKRDLYLVKSKIALASGKTERFGMYIGKFSAIDELIMCIENQIIDENYLERLNELLQNKVQEANAKGITIDGLTLINLIR